MIVDVAVRLSDSVDVEFAPRNAVVRNEKFGEYSYQISQGTNTFQTHRDLRIQAKRVPVKEHADFPDFCQACLRQEEETVLLRKR